MHMLCVNNPAVSKLKSIILQLIAEETVRPVILIGDWIPIILSSATLARNHVHARRINQIELQASAG